MRSIAVLASLLVGVAGSLILLTGCGGGSSSGNPNPNPNPTPTSQLTVQSSGTGSGVVTSTPAGISCGNTCSSSFSQGSQVTLNAVADPGSVFAGWSGPCSGTAACTLTVTANQTVMATFNITSQLTVQSSGIGTGVVTSTPAGISCGNTCSSSFTQGSQVTLNAVADPGSVFAGWSGPCSGTAACTLTVTANQTVMATFNITSQLTVQSSGTGTGVVTSTPAGISCGNTCSSSFTQGSQVTLNAVADPGSVFAGWNGPCSGTAACTLTMTANQTVMATFNITFSLQSINHIIFMAQENRSFDHYFGALRQYWADNGYPDQQFDGLPQFPTSSPSGPPPTNPGCDPAFPFPGNDCVFDSNSPNVQSYHLQTTCVENPSPSWNESHVGWNLTNPVSPTATLDGFVWAAGHDSRNMVPPFFDTDGVRTMGYYDGTDLNYYYFMASNFATSDRWFSPVMSRTALNRMYMLAGTSHG